MTYSIDGVSFRRNEINFPRDKIDEDSKIIWYNANIANSLRLGNYGNKTTLNSSF